MSTDLIWEIERDAKGMPVRMWWVGSAPKRPTWRERAAEVIRAVIAAHPTARGPELMDLLRAAYPFGTPQFGTPYGIWRKEIRLQLGVEKRPHRKHPSARDPVPAEQGALFETSP